MGGLKFRSERNTLVGANKGRGKEKKRRNEKKKGKEEKRKRSKGEKGREEERERERGSSRTALSALVALYASAVILTQCSSADCAVRWHRLGRDESK